MATSETAAMPEAPVGEKQEAAPVQNEIPRSGTPTRESNGEAKLPATPTRKVDKPLPKEPKSTPRIKKKIPWNGKNILVLLPRDEERGQPGKAPRPLRQNEIEKMFASWRELGYRTDGFDLLVEGYQPPGTDDSQSRGDWPQAEDLIRERSQKQYQVQLPDLNAWKTYENELLEAKLRALGVSMPDEEPPAPPSPPMTNPSRQASAQYPLNPFSPPLPASSASSNHNQSAMGFPFQHFNAQSPGIASPGPYGHQPGKYNPRQSISFPPSGSPYQFNPQGQWPGVQGMDRSESPSFAHLNGMISPQSPFGVDGMQPTGSPAFNLHQRQASLQYPMLPHQQLQHQQSMRASPRLQEVREDDEGVSKSPSKTPEARKMNKDGLQAEIEDAEYHLEEQFRTQLEHEDYSPQQNRRQSGQPVSEHFANEPGKPMVLHHPRPHSRGHSLTQNNYYEDGNSFSENAEHGNLKQFAPMNGIPEGQRGDESYEVDTNPSNLGTPNPAFDMSASLGHQKNASTVSNPWVDSTTQRPSHSTKPSLSKLNVKAPEFKFNPEKTFTPSGSFNFGGQPFQTTVLNTGIQEPYQPPAAFEPEQPKPEEPIIPSIESKEEGEISEVEKAADVKDVATEELKVQPRQERESSIPAFTGNTSDSAQNDTFASGQNVFSFASSGPKFRPDAPAFTPLRAVTSPMPSNSGHGSRPSIFGNIRISSAELDASSKRSRAVPIVRPTSRRTSSPKSEGQDAHLANEDEHGRPLNDARSKRAKSSAPDGDDVPLFANRPEDSTPTLQEAQEPAEEQPTGEQVLGEDNKAEESDTPEGGDDTVLVHEIAEEPAAEAEHDQPEPENAPADTSLSSIGTDHHIETKTTTTAPSESSPVEVADGDKTYKPFEFDSQFEARNFSEARPVGDESFFKESGHSASLSATAQPFVPGEGFASPAAADTSVETSAKAVERKRSASPTPTRKSLGLGASRFASPSPPPKPKGLAASRFADASSPEPEPVQEVLPSVEQEPFHEEHGDQTFEEIDAIMEEMAHDPRLGVKKTTDSVNRAAPVTEARDSPMHTLESPPLHSQYATEFASREYQELPKLQTPELEDPFLDPVDQRWPAGEGAEQSQSPLASDWEEAFSADEHEKLASRAQFFDGRVNQVVGNLLASRLEPLEQALFSIQDALAYKSRRPTSSRLDRRSMSAELRQSDADDEDEEPAPRRSLSPRRDRKMDQIRAAVLESLTAHQQAQPTVARAVAEDDSEARNAALLAAITEMREQVLANSKPDFGGDELKNLIENAVQSRMPPPADPDVELFKKMEALQSKVEDLEDQLSNEQSKVEKEVTARRAAEDTSTDLQRQLQNAETRIEIENINKSVFDQRVSDLEEKLRHQEERTEAEVENRRSAEDRLSENQRLLRISSEEEQRLREANAEKDERIRNMEKANSKLNMKMALLEANSTNSTQSHAELTNKVNALEADLRAVRQDNNHWRAEAERSDEAARRHAGELAHTVEENKHLQKSLSTLTTQLEENERLRESWRGKYMSLQDDMSNAAREIAEENARRIKKDQTMFARQEVLDARLQAEAKTRERLELEMDRLQMNERSGMRATKECERLETLLGELRTENHKLQQRALAADRDYEEARESGASEVKRTRMAMQTEVDAANHQVNLVREELEEQNNKLRQQLEAFKLEADHDKAHHEMMLEESENTKTSALDELRASHQNELEDLQARHEQQRNTAADEHSKTEQSLLERLSFSASRIEHFQDRIAHLEEKLEVAKEAAAAAAAAAKSAGVDARSGPASPEIQQKSAAISAQSGVPEKISPQALRESIMVLQEQLQAREQRIEELEQTVAKSDPDAANKISKRDDEISWLRELLAVRHGDLQDIIMALSSENVDGNRVKDAAIRLKASLQMEEQERERAMNGASAINLPSLAQSIQSATPRVAQSIGAAWGSWRKGSTASLTSMSGRTRLNSAAASRNATPSKAGPGPQHPNLHLGGLMTPPASSIRQSPLVASKPQPTAFGSTGRRYPSHGGGSQPGQERRTSMTVRQSENMPAPEAVSPQLQRDEPPVTPPMMRPAVYDSDAQAGDFDDEGFFVDE